MKKLKEYKKWEFGGEVLSAAIDGMNNRASIETEAAKFSNIIAEHGEIFDGALTYRHQILSLLFFCQKLGFNYKGRLLELGAGTGTISAMMSRIKHFREIISVEYSENFVKETMPLVFKHFKANVDKIQRVNGDFNRLKLEDNSIDCAVEVGSFHHSESIQNTINEVYRVLKPNSVLICLERAHPDNTTEEELEKLRNQELPDFLKIKYGIPVEKKFTRSDWGEHEYRVEEWKHYFNTAGFDVLTFNEIDFRMRGFGRLLNYLPILDPGLRKSLKESKNGKRDLWAYGFSHNRIAFLCVKKTTNQK